MNTTKTLMLAAVASLSLGLGAAMAQEGPSDFFADQNSQTAVHQVEPHAAAASAGSVRSFWLNSTPVQQDVPLGGGYGN